MLYSWEHPQRIEASGGPRSFLPPRLSFTVLLPARHEEKVIRQTLSRVLSANYPAHLLEVVVICHVDDTGTIAEAERAISELGLQQARVETFADAPINKPHGLNVGFARTGNEVVTIFDAEDDIDGNIFNVVNTVMLSEETGIVQAGVQLMNFKDHWFGMHNCLEYFFYFKSRLHYHARVGMIPLGGNTVFIRRELIARVGGWDQHCLTEDADIGLRLSLLGEPIRVVYDAQHVTREETPESVGSFIRQRTRWNQGFIQVLMKDSWRSLPHFGQRLLALYTLSYPLLQAVLMLLWPATILALLLAQAERAGGDGVVPAAVCPGAPAARIDRWWLSLLPRVQLPLPAATAAEDGGDVPAVPVAAGHQRRAGRLPAGAQPGQLGEDGPPRCPPAAAGRHVVVLRAAAGRGAGHARGGARQRDGPGSVASRYFPSSPAAACRTPRPRRRRSRRAGAWRAGSQRTVGPRCWTASRCRAI